jgi:hypothetical protein
MADTSKTRFTAALVLMAFASIITGCTSDAEPDASAKPSESSSSQQSPTPGSTIEGFVRVEDFPIRFVVPKGFTVGGEGGGTRAYFIKGTTSGGGVLLLKSFGGIPAAKLPADLAALVRKHRDDIIVSNVRTTEVGGRPAEAFTLKQKPGTAPWDLWCAKAGTCFKLLDNKPMEMAVVRHPQGVVLFSVEYLPEERVTVRRAWKEWLAGVEWT